MKNSKILLIFILFFCITLNNTKVSYSNPLLIAAISPTGLAVLAVSAGLIYVSQHPALVGDIASSVSNANLLVNSYVYNPAFVSATTGLANAFATQAEISGQAMYNYISAAAQGGSMAWNDLLTALGPYVSPAMPVISQNPTGNVVKATDNNKYKITGNWTYSISSCTTNPPTSPYNNNIVSYGTFIRQYVTNGSTSCPNEGYSCPGTEVCFEVWTAPCGSDTTDPLTPTPPPVVGSPTVIAPAITANPAAENEVGNYIAAQPNAVTWTNPAAPTSAQINAANSANALAALQTAATQTQTLATANPTNPVVAAQAVAAQAAVTQAADQAQNVPDTASAPTLTIPTIRSIDFSPATKFINQLTVTPPFSWASSIFTSLSWLSAPATPLAFTIDLGITQIPFDCTFMSSFVGFLHDLLSLFFICMTGLMIVRDYQNM